MDFTLRKYEKLLQAIKKAEIRVYKVRDWVQKQPDSGVLMRHDVDRWAGNALEMAELEASYGLQTTYYFRVSTANPKIIRAIAAMGHEIGYHYEDLSLAKGDFEKAGQLFREHLAQLRQYAPVDTAAMHGRPLSGIDNRDLWQKYKPKDFGLIAEAFRSIGYRDVYYVTDSGRSWSETAANLRDSVETNQSTQLRSTDDLIRFMENAGNSKVAVVAHPERWNNNSFKWALYFCWDMIVNLIKRFLKLIRF